MLHYAEPHKAESTCGKPVTGREARLLPPWRNAIELAARALGTPGDAFRYAQRTQR